MRVHGVGLSAEAVAALHSCRDDNDQRCARGMAHADASAANADLLPAATLVSSRPDLPRYLDGTRVLRGLAELPPVHVQVGHSRHVPPGAPYTVYATVCRGDRTRRADFATSAGPERPCGEL